MNMKREKIFLEVSLINYRKRAMKIMKNIRRERIAQLEKKREKEIIGIFKSKLKKLKVFDD